MSLTLSQDTAGFYLQNMFPNLTTTCPAPTESPLAQNLFSGQDTSSPTNTTGGEDDVRNTHTSHRCQEEWRKG